MESALKLVVTVGTDSTMVRMQHYTIVRLRCDTMYILHGFIPVEEKGMVSVVMGMVVDLGTCSVPVKNPTFWWQWTDFQTFSHQWSRQSPFRPTITISNTVYLSCLCIQWPCHLRSCLQRQSSHCSSDWASSATRLRAVTSSCHQQACSCPFCQLSDWVRNKRWACGPLPLAYDADDIQDMALPWALRYAMTLVPLSDLVCPYMLTISFFNTWHPPTCSQKGCTYD